MIVPQIERQAPIFEQYQIINQLKKVSVKSLLEKSVIHIPYLGLNNAHWCIMHTPSWPLKYPEKN
jgi:hypothetical protein